MTRGPETRAETDAVDLLIHQHKVIRRLVKQVDGKAGEARAEAFDRLRRFLAVHETAEKRSRPRSRRPRPWRRHARNLVWRPPPRAC